jgi:hypothetical protein
MSSEISTLKGTIKTTGSKESRKSGNIHVDSGYMSPYPTEDIVTSDHHMDVGMFTNSVFSTFL